MKLTPMAVAVFLCGIFGGYKFDLLGEVYAAEFMLIAMAAITVFSGRTSALLKEKVFWLLFFSLLVTLSGYMISDLVRDTPPELYLRGWGRIALMMMDFLALAMLAAHDKRTLWWLVLGMGLGGLAQAWMDGMPMGAWKTAYGVPAVLSVAALSHFFPLRAASALLMAMGVANIVLDFRILAAVCLLMAALLWARSRRPALAMRGAQVMRVVLPAGMAGVILLAGLAMTEDSYLARREQSNLGRAVGIEVGMHAVAVSPLIGYGSWSSSRELDTMRSEAYSKQGAEKFITGGQHFSPHSQLLQAWMEGGVLGAVFFMVYGYQLLRVTRHVALVRAVDGYTPVFLFFMLFGLWNLLMSPFAGVHRLHIAFAAAVFCAVALERSSGERS